MTLRRFREWTWSLFALHSDTPFVCAARNVVDRLSELLHAENHDFRTNGEAKVLGCLSTTATTILDVGANRGAWALEARKHCPKATIYCFEISSETRKHLRKNLVGRDGVKILDFGLADRSGLERVKYYPELDTRTSIYDYPVGESYVWNEYPVQTGDKFIQEHGLQHIDLLKIDTEGADFRVLRGFETALTRSAISVVQFEYGFACILARSLLIDFYDYLESRGYIVGKLHSAQVDFRAYRLKDENFFGPNFVAVHRSRGEIIARLADPSWRPKNHPA